MALDPETRNSLFGGLKQSLKEQPKKEIPHVELTGNLEETQQPEVAKKTAVAPARKQKSPKWQTLDKVTVLLTTEQKEGLDRVARKLMRYRSSELKGRDDKERITANTLIRGLVEVFLQSERAIQLETLSSEDDVCEWLAKNFKSVS
jgi:mannitol/fructose-specific phosphotransferase system IIA component (Ntr-type)